MREEHRQRVLENVVLGKTFGPKRDEVMGEWRRPHYEDLYSLYKYYWCDQIKKDEMGRACSTYGR